MRRQLVTAVLSAFSCLSVPAAPAAATGDASGPGPFAETRLAARAEGRRVVCADIAAIDQTLVYNRFGSFNPFGMIFALDRDLAPLAPTPEAGPPVDLSGA